ncbi:bis(5'-nucleosyl)-tetraphosphatase (symmetrical) YqeK [Clostridium bowmanii]|uniref:bis(5'-nucleosyl)-tetraphosphatase (symmetrical) YqeK n=1 Tax=Clostridium bowmanii TaxID=132925 RepID=UPI001C0BDF37|nr:bis(5'-nucleosyl)-tetraphosphatase (symmetrical) YqeK [Clostridium bowmanii]MBU3189745.1 bis(5'-nucleosyl)-tetraphosphatase (symmetrical) YqeK [Clostridium bowmanii]MCA1074227.1 bis(5'-nucleosyl)-tetraphosphatase (symmetrical) YqeK [Clostridium bowmanii]
MWNEGEMLHYLQLNLSEGRLQHSLGVSETAVALAEKYGANIENARIAGLVHDCGKNMKDDQLIKVASEHEVQDDEIYIQNPSILHGLVGSIIAREVMGIQDEDILAAICYHTTGRKNMSILEKIIYIADYIEPLRKFKGVEELRFLSYIDLDAAVIQSLENTIKYVINQKELLHMDTVEARNYLLSKDKVKR